MTNHAKEFFVFLFSVC